MLTTIELLLKKLLRSAHNAQWCHFGKDTKISRALQLFLKHVKRRFHCFGRRVTS